MKIFGLKYSWEAIATKNERPNIMQWQSTTGLQNFGTVEFHPIRNTSSNSITSSSFPNDNKDDDNTIQTSMTLQMTFVAPRAVSAMFRLGRGGGDGGRSNKDGGGGRGRSIARYVEQNLITKSLYKFRDVVLQNDLLLSANDSNNEIHQERH